MARRKKRRQSGFVDIVNGFLSLLVIGIIVVIAVSVFGLNWFYGAGPTSEEKRFIVEQGNGLGTVADRLEQQGLISNGLVFRAGSWVKERNPVLKPGEFAIPAGASMADVLAILTEGDPIPYRVTIPEGWTSWQVAQEVRKLDYNLTGDLADAPPEGSVMPGTYDYFPGATRESVVDQMEARMQTELDKIWANRAPDLPLKSKEELVILASIVEKETGLASERGKVAGLFVNRLKQNMPLQTDPTIIYGITGGRTNLEGGITQSQKDQETPYNTYKFVGLPPTPIANPGIEALIATANPEATDAVYMMAVTPNKPSDGHYFAATLAEHQQNEARYRELERAARAVEQAEDTPAAQ